MSAPVVLITGALTRIGRVTALAFAKEGAQVIAGRHDDAAATLVEELAWRTDRIYLRRCTP